MDTCKLLLVHLSEEEISSKGADVVLLPDALKEEISKKFFGRYASGTPPMGYVPNAIILKDE